MDDGAHLDTLEQDYMFEKGVKIGLNELSFIKGVLGDGVVLL